mgnify:CR=1 FL=1
MNDGSWAILVCVLTVGLIVSIIFNCCQSIHARRHRAGVVRPVGYKKDTALLGASSGEMTHHNSTTTFISSGNISRTELNRSGVSITFQTEQDFMESSSTLSSDGSIV